MRYIFNPITEALEAPDNPSPMYDNLGKRFNLVEGGLARQPFAPENVVRVAGPEVYKITGTSSRASPIRDAVLEVYKKFKNTFKKVPSAEEIWKYQSIKKVLGKTSGPLDYIRYVLKKGNLPYKFEIESGKSETLRKHLRTLKDGALIDTGKATVKFKMDISGLKRIIDEPEFANKKFNIFNSNIKTYASDRRGKPRKGTLPISPVEMKKIESLYSSQHNNLKGRKLIDALYAAGKGHGFRSVISNLRAGFDWDRKTRGHVRDTVLAAYEKFKKTNKQPPRTGDLYKYKSVSELFVKGSKPNRPGGNVLRENALRYIGRVLNDANLAFTPGKELLHGSTEERARFFDKQRRLKIEQFSDIDIEEATKGKRGLRIPKFELGPFKFKGMEIGGIHKHHMNSLRQNVNMRNVAYLSAGDNLWFRHHIEGELGRIYSQREELLKNKPKGWKEEFNKLNDKGRKILNKVPERLKGLLNFEVKEVKPNGTFKSSNIGMDWRKSIGAEAGEVGKIDFNKLNKSQKQKVIALHTDAYKDFKANRFKAFKPGAGAAGTLGGLGIAAGAVAAGAEYQGGKPLYDVFANMPLEFATLGMIPATEISQQARIYNDLKAQGLSHTDASKKLALYNRGKAQEAIDKDEVGLESYALSGLKEGETKEQAYAVRGDEDIELMERKIKRGYNPETGKWESERFVDEVEFAEGGIVPRVAYRDGSNWLDKLTDDDVYNLSRGWRSNMEMDPDVMDRIKQKQILDAQAANEAGFKHRSQYEDTGSFIPEYVQDVVKKGFGTEEGLKYMGSKAGEGALEGFEWFIYQIPHLMKELDKRGLTVMDGQAVNKMQKYLKENKGKMNWMELMYTPNWGEEFLGFKMNDFQKEQMQKLKDRFGETEIPEGIASTGTAAELGAMFLADPFIIWGLASKARKLKGKKDKLVNVDETIDIGKRDTLKSVGAVGLTAFLATAFPFLFKAKKNITAAKNVAKVAETVKQFGNVRGMPDWFPAFILKAKNKGMLKSLPDKDYIEPLIYEIMLPVKRKYYTSTNKDRGMAIKSDPDGNPITSKGEKDHWGATGRHTETRIEEVPVTVTHNPNTGEMTVSWTGTNNFGDEIERSFNYRAGETGSQNYAIDETGKGVSKERVIVEEPEFQYTEPDYSSMGFEDTSPDSASYLDAFDDADEIVEAMEAFVKGEGKEFKTQAANEMKLYNETDVHYGNAEGRQNIDGDWIEGENNLPIKGSDDKGVTDVYHPKWDRKKKAMGGKADGPPPLSGPVPEGLRSLKPGVIYNEWIN